MSSLSRRELNRLLLTGGLGGTALTAAGLGGLALPRIARAASISAGDRKFLFIFCWGGWDFSYVFQPLFDNKYVSEVSNSEPDTAGGIEYVASTDRPRVTEFIHQYSDQICFINGIEVPSVAHDRCERLTMTGGSSPDADDWPAIIAASSNSELLMPHAIFDGPGYSSQFGRYVVRVGENGQLPQLIEGSALEYSDTPITIPNADVDLAVDQFILNRSLRVADEVAARSMSNHASDYGSVLDILLNSTDDLSEVDLAAESSKERCIAATTLFENGLSRCAMVNNLGLYSSSWDTHASNIYQSYHFQLLFDELTSVMTELHTKTNPVSGNLLADEVTVVVLSEMGRAPTANDGGGKDHWTWTSAMLIGSGVKGDQVIGRFGEQVTGEPIDFDSGEVTESGETMDMANLGATLLAMADVDPDEHLLNTEIISAVMDG